MKRLERRIYKEWKGNLTWMMSVWDYDDPLRKDETLNLEDEKSTQRE